MSDSQAWYQRKLAALRAAPQQRQQQQQQPGQRLQAGQEFVQFQRQPEQRPPQVTMDNLWDSMQQWRGGKAHRVDSQPCPHCGSDKYYSRTDGDGPRRGPPPAPHCFECGYNGLFEQGLATAWQPS